MDSTLDLPCEARLSNSMLRSRPTPPTRTQLKRTKTKPNDTTNDHIVPIKDVNSNNDNNSFENISSTITDKQKLNVVFRRIPVAASLSSNRNCTVRYPYEDFCNQNSMPVDFSNITLFYVTSSNHDKNVIVESNSKPLNLSCQEKILSEFNQNDLVTNKSSSSLELIVTSSENDEEDSIVPNTSNNYLYKIQENKSNCVCADCNSQYPTVAILSWLLVICKKCSDIHKIVTSHFLHLQKLNVNNVDSDMIELLVNYGNQYSNNLLEYSLSNSSKPNVNSTKFEREQFIRKKYIDKLYLRPYQMNKTYTIDQLNRILYENVETSDIKTTLHLIMLGADTNYVEKMFTVADHAKRHQQIEQMKIILENGGLSEFDLMKTNTDDVNEKPVHLSNRHRILKEFLTRYESDHLKVYPHTSNIEKSQRCLCDIELIHVVAVYNQNVNVVSLKCRFTNSSSATQTRSQCTLFVDEQTSSCEYTWVFPNELERSIWTREIIKRKYSYHQIIYSNFILVMELYIQEGINSEKQQVTGIVYPGRFVVCSDTIFDEVDLRKYSSLTYQKTDEFRGVLLCLITNRFLYLSSPITKLLDILYSSLRQAVKVKSLTDLNQQILTSQNIPVIVERFINFIFEYGLLTKGIYRQAGQEIKIRQLLNECFDDPHCSSLTIENYSEHDVANALKRFLRLLDVQLLGTRENYNAWLRSTVDERISNEQLIQYYRGLLKNLKQNFPIHYSTLRTMIIHIDTVSKLSERNGMTLSNLVSTFAPCLVSQATSPLMNYSDKAGERRKMSLDDIDKMFSNNTDEETSHDSGSNSHSVKVKRNQSFDSGCTLMTNTTTNQQFQFSSSYVHVTPSIQADFIIMTNLCKYSRQLFDITDEEIEHENMCIQTLLSINDNQCIPHKLDGTMISVYYESRADELNAYAMIIFENETTADIIIDKLLNQLNKNDCFFLTLFEVIIDQSLERPMYSCENVSDVLYRFRGYLSRELNRQAAFVVKLNYVQFEKERLHQRTPIFNNKYAECEYFDSTNQRWTPCAWIFERALLQVHRVLNNSNEKTTKSKLNHTQQKLNSNVQINEQTLLYCWSVEDIYLYIGADRRFINAFDMNEYRVLTILPPDINTNENSTDFIFGQSFRFYDRNQMFSWYLELAHVSGHDKWTRRAPRTIPDGVNYLPLQNYHTSSTTTRKKPESVNKFISKSCHVASNLYKQLRK